MVGLGAGVEERQLPGASRQLTCGAGANTAEPRSATSLASIRNPAPTCFDAQDSGGLLAPRQSSGPLVPLGMLVAQLPAQHGRSRRDEGADDHRQRGEDRERRRRLARLVRHDPSIGRRLRFALSDHVPIAAGPRRGSRRPGSRWKPPGSRDRPDPGRRAPPRPQAGAQPRRGPAPARLRPPSASGRACRRHRRSSGRRRRSPWRQPRRSSPGPTRPRPSRRRPSPAPRPETRGRCRGRRLRGCGCAATASAGVR